MRKHHMRETYPNLDYLPYARQTINQDDIRAVVEVLKSRNLTQGATVAEFESTLCDVTGAPFAAAVNSGTSALHIACLAAGIRPGDEVITSPLTFVASSNCVLYCSGKPVFADINPETYNISPSEIRRKITRRTRAIIPVHFAGQSCDMEAIKDIVEMNEEKYGHKIYIIEDACHALGSLYKNRKVGSCVLSDMTIMSFHAAKHITTGEGGTVLTSDSDLFRKVKSFSSHGITSEPDEFVYSNQAFQRKTCTPEPLLRPWYYEQLLLGYNYRITDIQCALGLSQLKRLPEIVKRRREIVDRYNECFGDLDGVEIPRESPDCVSNFHLYVLLIDFSKIGIARAEFMHRLKCRGIQTQVHYIPVHTQPFYQETLGTGWGDNPHAEEYYQKCLSLPLFYGMTEEDVKKVSLAVSELVKERK